MDAIVAFDKNLGIGYKNDLPWNKISADFKHFKNFTLNKTIIVGSTTFDTLPPLKNREIKVLTRNIDKLNNWHSWENVEFFSLARFFGQKEFLEWSKKFVVCGGAKVYEELIHLCDSVTVTHVNSENLSDVYFPYNLEELTNIFPYKYYITEFDGGHKVIKYSKK